MAKSGNKGKKPKPRITSQERGVLRRLQQVERCRDRFSSLLLGLARDAVAEACGGDGTVAEIGAGDGQLRAWLPASVAQRTIHTEPLKAGVQAFARRWPEAQVERASAEELPFDDAELSCVVALCVMDVVANGADVARELRRVLKRGGCFLHLLDMSTELADAFTMLRAGRVVPLPNVFGDPCAVQWPEDLMLIPYDQLAAIHALLRGARHPFAKPLAQYLKLFDARQPFFAQHAAAEYRRILEDVKLRSAVRQLFRTAYELAPPEHRAALARYRGQPASSARFFEQRLRGWFNTESGFEVVRSEISTACMIGEAPTRYASVCVGEMRELDELPERLLHPPAPEVLPGVSLLEAGVFVFLARRV